MKKNIRARSSKQKGHALTEFIVLAIALVPLFLLMPLIGKYQDISHSVLAASRYVAFDMLTRYNNPKPQAQLEQEVRHRFFSSSTSAIKTNDAAGDVKTDQNPHWRDPQNRALISKFSDIQVHTNWEETTGSVAALNNSANETVRLPKRDLFTATITVPIINLPTGLRYYKPLDKLNLQISRRTSVAPDTWAASGPGQVQAQLDRPLLIPLSTALKTLSPFVKTFNKVVDPGVSEPKLGELQFWADQLPLDRLQ